MTDRSAREIWQAALGELQIEVSKPNFNTWLKNTRGVSYQEDQFIVEAPNAFAAAFLEKHLHSLVRKTLMGITGRSLEVHFQVSLKQESIPCPSTAIPDEAQAQQRPQRQPPTSHFLRNRFNPGYTFDSFIVGSSNRLAHAAALAVAEGPGRSYNPLFIYSGVGLGKTHLLHAIGHVLLGTGLQVLYVTGEQFTNEFINSIRQRTTDDFRNKCRSVDILLMDDIQFLSGKEQTQEGFFHTFNELHDANRQIVVTSDRPPRSMPLLQDRLRSRFEWGLLADIQPPDLETRLAILNAKLEQQPATVPPEVLEFIARKIQKNIRELEGSLNRILAYAKLTRESLSVELAKQALQDISSTGQPLLAITPSEVIDAVSRYFNLDPKELQSKKRQQSIASPRQIAMYLMREETHCPLAEIGRLLGGRDHSTILHGYQKIASQISIDSQLRRNVVEIREQLYANRSCKKPVA